MPTPRLARGRQTPRLHQISSQRHLPGNPRRPPSRPTRLAAGNEASPPPASSRSGATTAPVIAESPRPQLRPPPDPRSCRRAWQARTPAPDPAVASAFRSPRRRGRRHQAARGLRPDLRAPVRPRAPPPQRNPHCPSRSGARRHRDRGGRRQRRRDGGEEGPERRRLGFRPAAARGSDTGRGYVEEIGRAHV